MPHFEKIGRYNGIWLQGAWYSCDYDRFVGDSGRPGERGICCPWHHMQFGTRNKDDTVDYNICNQNLFLHKKMNEPVHKLVPIENVKDQWGRLYYMIPDWCPRNRDDYWEIKFRKI